MLRALARMLSRAGSRRSAQQELFVHEDDWGRIGAFPVASAAWCVEEMRRIDRFADDHAAPGGGWTDMYVRDAPPRTLAELGISFPHSGASLGAKLPRFDVVTSGTFSSPQPVPRVTGFGPTHNAGVVLTPDQGGDVVTDITLVLNGTREACTEVLSALKSLPSADSLLLVDWSRGAIVALDDNTAIERYLEALHA